MEWIIWFLLKPHLQIVYRRKWAKKNLFHRCSIDWLHFHVTKEGEKKFFKNWFATLFVPFCQTLEWLCASFFFFFLLNVSSESWTKRENDWKRLFNASIIPSKRFCQKSVFYYLSMAISPLCWSSQQEMFQLVTRNHVICNFALFTLCVSRMCPKILKFIWTFQYFKPYW